MGAGQSKHRKAQYPYGAPPYPPPLPPPPHYVPPYGYGQPFYPPQTAHLGHANYLQPNFLPQDKYFKKSSRASKSRRTQPERFVGGFSAGTGMPQPEGPHRRTTSDSYTRAPQYGSARRGSQRPPRRTATPFMPQGELDADESDEDQPSGDDSVSNHSVSRRSTMRYSTPPSLLSDFPHPPEHLEPPSSAAYGPQDYRPRPPLRNPLPPPPRDLYEMTPYKSLLTLPQTTALLTATYAPQQTADVDPGSTHRHKKSVKSGLLRVFSRKPKQKEREQPQVHFIPVFTPNENNPTSQTQPLQQVQQQQQQQQRHQPHHHQQHQQQQQQQLYQPVSASAIGSAPMSATTTYHPLRATTPAESEHPQPVPPVPTSPPAIRFDQTGRYAAFMNHSPHRVIWGTVPYPTALHLHEALKFMDTRPDLAEKIRTCERPEDVYPLSASFHQFQRRDWGMVFLDLMKQVLYQKFRQHPDLRTLLVQTGTARLIYVDADDTYWGSGAVGNGQNELGKALVEIRDRLFHEMNYSD